ncbi:hypothetical protein DERF_007319 [Dermatophagoides farinae]|uniref:Uncharacterized protein n=1 Tax=Dermatophagoides farinae TaxID=6954 RepID=A0A922I089_DERFA|nr:hypothetical protein DERF_007319 [Dermatophagoides farinae]
MKFSTISSYDDYLVLTNVNQYVSCYDKFHLAVYTADFRLCVSVQKLIKLKTSGPQSQVVLKRTLDGDIPPAQLLIAKGNHVKFYFITMASRR